MGRRAWTGALALVVVACGGAGAGKASTSAGDPGEAGTSVPSDGGTTGPGVTDAGAVDSGTGIVPGDAGSSDAGTPAVDAGAPDGGQLDGGTPDGGAPTDGGVPSCVPAPEPPAASCDELMPPLPLDAPQRFLGPTLSSAGDPVCLPGAFSGDRDGFLGVMRTLAEDKNGRASRFELDLLSPDGSLLRGPPEDTSPFAFVVPLLQGAGALRTDRDAQGTLVRIDPSGATSEVPAGMVRAAAAMPGGGGTVAAEGGTLYTMDGRTLTAPMKVTRRDDAGTILWSTPIPTSIAPDPTDAQVYPNGAGHVLAAVALDSYQVRMLWLDENGQIVNSADTHGVFSTREAVGPSLELPDHSLAFHVSPAHSSGGWLVVHDLATGFDVPPCWLDRRRETRVFSIGGGRGYAVFHGSTFAGNERRHGLEIVTSNGESCGWIDATCGDPTPGTCDLSFANVGLDGTLYLNGVSERAPEQCLVESWPALLR